MDDNKPIMPHDIFEYNKPGDYVRIVAVHPDSIEATNMRTERRVTIKDRKKLLRRVEPKRT